MGEISRVESKELRALSMVSEVNAHIREFFRDTKSALENAVAAGEKMRKQKELIPHGQWTAFCEQHYPQVTLRSIQNWMKAAEIVQKRNVSFLEGDTLTGLISYDKIGKYEENGSSVRERSQTNGKPERAGKSKPAATETTAPPRAQDAGADGSVEDPLFADASTYEEQEVEAWEYNRDEHQALVDAINRFGRFLTEVMADEAESEYIAHVETRLRADMKQLKTTVWQNCPVGEKGGRIVTRNQQQSRKK